MAKRQPVRHDLCESHCCNARPLAPTGAPGQCLHRRRQPGSHHLARGRWLPSAPYGCAHRRLEWHAASIADAGASCWRRADCLNGTAKPGVAPLAPLAFTSWGIISMGSSAMADAPLFNNFTVLASVPPAGATNGAAMEPLI